MDLSWSHPPAVSVNGFTPKDTYQGDQKKMHLPSVRDVVQLIQETGKLFSCTVMTFHKPIDSSRWTHVTGHWWAVFCCQDITSLEVRSLEKDGMQA